MWAGCVFGCFEPCCCRRCCLPGQGAITAVAGAGAGGQRVAVVYSALVLESGVVGALACLVLVSLEEGGGTEGMEGRGEEGRVVCTRRCSQCDGVLPSCGMWVCVWLGVCCGGARWGPEPASHAAQGAKCSFNGEWRFWAARTKTLSRVQVSLEALTYLLKYILSTAVPPTAVHTYS